MSIKKFGLLVIALLIALFIICVFLPIPYNGIVGAIGGLGIGVFIKYKLPPPTA